jgi:UDP:flavonoid glycosyltransferase YjiC (YdhE family)
MSRILFAWEMGSNFGHLVTLLPLAERLRDQGHEVLFAIRDLRHAHEFVSERGFRFLSAPTPSADLRLDPRFMPVSYADMLMLEGMGSIHTAMPLVEAWHTLFDLFKPDAIVVEHAPVAMLSAQLVGLKRIAIGTGFALPPLTNPFPIFRQVRQARHGVVLQAEQHIANTLNRLCLKYGKKPVEKAADIFRGTARMLTTLPELDHYGSRPAESYLGRISGFQGSAKLERPAWPANGKKVLLYMQPSYRGLDGVLRGLQRAGCAVMACVPGVAAGSGGNSGNVVVSSNRLDVEALLPEAELVVTHGGHGLVCQALLHGKPLIMLPQQLEQSLLARRVQKYGAGKTLTPQHGEVETAQAATALLEQHVFRDAARQFQAKYASLNADVAIDKVLDVLQVEQPT